MENFFSSKVLMICLLIQIVSIARNVDCQWNSPFNKILLPMNRRPILLNQKPSYKMHEKPPCTGSTKLYCTDDTQYDSIAKHAISRILDRMPVMHDIFPHVKEEIFEVSTRAGGNFITETEACTTREQVIYPKRGQTQSQDWVFIPNQDSFKQGVRVELCHNEGSQCHIRDIGFVKTVCRQKYLYRKILTLDGKGTNLVTDLVYLPSCCVCFVSDI